MIAFVILSSAASTGSHFDTDSVWISTIVALLSFFAGIAILFHPADPDRSSIAVLGMLSIVSIVGAFGGRADAPASLLAFYAIYEISAYSSARIRHWLCVWIYVGAIVPVLFDRSLVETFSGHEPLALGLDTAEAKTLLTYVCSVVLVSVVVSIPWLLGAFMRGRRRPVAE